MDLLATEKILNCVIIISVKYNGFNSKHSVKYQFRMLISFHRCLVSNFVSKQSERQYLNLKELLFSLKHLFCIVYNYLLGFHVFYIAKRIMKFVL